MKITNKPIGSIKPYPNNPRKNDKAVATVAASLEQYGWQQPIVVDKDMVIIVGHTRYRAAQHLQLTEVPVLVAEGLTAEQARAYRLMDNRSNENSRWDDGLLMEELQAMLDSITIPEASEQTGFTESEIARLFKDDSEELHKLTTTLNPPTTSKPGDVWILGNHRLGNGDSTDPNMVTAVLAGDKIDLLWEDAPYGVAYATPGGINHSEEYNEATTHKIANDDLKGEKLDAFLQAHVAALLPHLRPGAAVYWCHDIRYNHQFKQILENNGIHIADTLIWRKNSTSNWLTDYAKFYEPILYGWREGAEHAWYGRGQQANAFTLQELEAKTKEQLIKIISEWDTNYQLFRKEPRKIASLHPTVKPVKLIEYHIYNSSKPSEKVYDGFSGSGSTLMACEITNRHARCIELEPKFVDTIIRRWQEHTGLTAIRESDGKAWTDPTHEITLEQEIHDNLVELFQLPKDDLNGSTTTTARA